MDTDAMIEKISRRLHEMKRERKYTQRDLARDLGVTPGAVNQWLNRTSALPLERLPEIANSLGFTMIELAPDAPLSLTLTDAEAKLVRCYRAANDQGKGAIDSVAEMAGPYGLKK